MRLEAHESVNRHGARGLLGGGLKGRIASFVTVDHYDPKTDMSAMMRTTAFPALIAAQMLASSAISKRGGVLQEVDVPADLFLSEIEKQGIRIDYAMEITRKKPHRLRAVRPLREETYENCQVTSGTLLRNSLP